MQLGYNERYAGGFRLFNFYRIESLMIVGFDGQRWLSLGCVGLGIHTVITAHGGVNIRQWWTW